MKDARDLPLKPLETLIPRPLLEPGETLKPGTVPVATNRAAPTVAEIHADPDRILELFNFCPTCHGTNLEALTWKSRGLDDVTVGCWNCGWHITPEGVPPLKMEVPDDDEGF